MSKAVLISIQPKWCELIARRIKTIEVRKTRPMLETPFKCYIYCTNNRTAGMELFLVFYGGKPKPGWVFPVNHETALRMGMSPMNGKVVGEFVCDQIEEIAVAFRGGDGPLTARGGNEVWNGGMVEHMSCLSTEDVCRYVGGVGGVGYGWHISNLKIYDQPKSLSEFRKPLEDLLGWNGEIIRPPQSWCYVREVNSR